MIHVKRNAIPDKFLMAACIAAIGAFLINQIWDPDTWWHLAIGRGILDRHAVPATDHFTVAAFGHPYHDSHWLFQVVMALADKVAGMIGVQAMMFLGWSAVLWFCWRSISHHVSSPANYLLLFFAAMASIERFTPRPEIVTMAMISAFWWLLQQRKYEGTKGLLLFGLLQVIWANSHGLFVIGPFMAGCYWLAVMLHQRQEEADFKQLSKLLGVLLISTLITPYGWEGWRYAVLLFTEIGSNAPGIFREIGELTPTFGAASQGGIAFWFFATLLAATTLTMAPLVLRGRISIARLLIVSGLFAAAMAGRRNMPLFAIVAAPFIAESLRLLFPQGPIKIPRIKTAATVTLTLAMLAWSWYPLSGAYYINNRIPSRFGLGATPSLYPYGLPQFLDRIGFKGQIYNSNLLGGFYLYHNYPERLPLTDGRWEIYDAKILEAIDKATDNPAIWSWMINTYDIKGLLFQHASLDTWAILPAIRSQNNWRLVYYDHAASFWMRNDAPRLPPAIDLAASKLPIDLSRIEDYLILNIFLSRMETDELKLQNLQRAIGLGQEMELILEQIGQTQIRLQRFDQAEETFKALLRDYPKNPDALNNLGFLAENRGNLVTAESLLRRALEISPNDPDIRDNHLRIKATLDRLAPVKPK